MRLRIISNKRYSFVFLFSFLIISLFCISSQAETVQEYTTDLNIYRFTQILDVSEDGNVDIWLIIELKFEEDDNPSDNYVLKFDLYPTDVEIEIIPKNSVYSDFLKNTTSKTGNESFVRFVIDKDVSQKYKYFSFGCKYKPRLSSVIKKVSLEGESYDRWRLNHYSGIPKSIGNYVRKFIILPESAKIKDMGDFDTDDEVLNRFENFAKLRYNDYEKPIDKIPIPGFDEIHSRNALFLYQINLEEIQSTIEYEIFHSPSQEYLIVFHVGFCLFLCFIAGITIYKNPEDIRNFTIIIIIAFLSVCLSPITSWYVYKDIQTMVGILVTLLALVLGVYTIGTSRYYAHKTEQLISDFEKRQNKRFDSLGRSIENIPGIVNRIINGAEESIPIQEERQASQAKLKYEITTPKYKDETSKLVEMVVTEIQRFFPVKTEVLSPTKNKRIDLIIQLPDKKVPVEIKRYSKRLVKEKIPTHLAQILKEIMREFGTNESVLIIMNKGVGKKAEKILKDVSPETIHLIKGIKIDTIRERLITLLEEMKKRYSDL